MEASGNVELEAYFQDGPEDGTVVRIEGAPAYVTFGDGEDYNQKAELVGPVHAYRLDRVEGGTCWYQYDPDAADQPAVTLRRPKRTR